MRSDQSWDRRYTYVQCMQMLLFFNNNNDHDDDDNNHRAPLVCLNWLSTQRWQKSEVLLPEPQEYKAGPCSKELDKGKQQSERNGAGKVNRNNINSQ